VPSDSLDCLSFCCGCLLASILPTRLNRELGTQTDTTAMDSVAKAKQCARHNHGSTVGLGRWKGRGRKSTLHQVVSLCWGLSTHGPTQRSRMHESGIRVKKKIPFRPVRAPPSPLPPPLRVHCQRDGGVNGAVDFDGCTLPSHPEESGQCSAPFLIPNVCL